MAGKYVVGVDFGSDSVRAVVVETASGRTAGCGTSYYPRWKRGLYQHPEKAIFRQHPLDYLEALEKCVQDAVSGLSGEEKDQIAGIGVDTTGSTPAPVDREGTPLALTEPFAECEDAMFHLWKDHSAAREAEEIDEAFSCGSSTDYGKYQGKYCAEWFWAKILRTVRENPAVREAAYTWVEHSDWIVGLLCGKTKPEEMYHSACAAGHKALWHSEWGGLPAGEVLGKLDPYLVLVRERYGRQPQPACVKAGTLTREWAEKLGLREGIAVSGSSFDAHAGAVGAGIRAGTMVCSIGTSAVDMLVEKAENLRGKNIRRFGGQAEDSVLPGYVGIETGQAAFGDIFAWFRKLLLWPIHQMGDLLDTKGDSAWYGRLEEQLLGRLQEQAAMLPPEPFALALDWFNGRRYPDTDESKKAVITGLTLGSDAPYVFRALVFGAVCGLKRIVDGFEQAGIRIGRLVAVGGIPRKSAYIMQMLADVLGKEITVLDSEQTGALGAGIYAAVAGGIYRDVETACRHMSPAGVKNYAPDPGKREFYREKYEEYLWLAATAGETF